LHALHRSLLRLCVVLNGLVDDLLLLGLLLSAQLVLQPENAGLRSKLLLTQRAQLSCGLVGQSVSSLLASDTLQANTGTLHTLTSPLQTNTSALKTELTGGNSPIHTREPDLSTLHTLSGTSQLLLQSLQANTCALHTKTVKLTGLTKTRKTGLLTSHSLTDTGKPELPALKRST
jgi:hypothetical protein